MIVQFDPIPPQIVQLPVDLREVHFGIIAAGIDQAANKSRHEIEINTVFFQPLEQNFLNLLHGLPISKGSKGSHCG
jgi:hypothetical protein